RGETATRVLVNEARDILDEEETYAAVEPMLLVTAGSLGIFSTPLGKSGRLWEAFSSPLYLKTRIPSRASRYAAPEHLERQRLEMSAPRFACEYEAAFLDVQSSFFSAESIARCAREYDVAMVREDDRTYALGVDWARTRDTSAMVVVSRDQEDHLRVVYLRGFLGVPMDRKLPAALRTLEFRVTPSGAMTIHYPGGGSDGVADATMLACWRFRRKPGGRPGAARISLGASRECSWIEERLRGRVQDC